MTRARTISFCLSLVLVIPAFAADPTAVPQAAMPQSTTPPPAVFPQAAAPQSMTPQSNAAPSNVRPATPAARVAPSTADLPPPVPQTPAVFSAAPAPSTPIDYKKFRDPFKEPPVNEVTEIKSDLERFAVTDFKVVAIITGPLRMRAMIVAPDTKTHYVSEKMKLGLRDGVIVKITTKTIVVREKVVNPLGEVELFDTEIGMDQPSVAGTTN